MVEFDNTDKSYTIGTVAYQKDNEAVFEADE